MEILLVVIGIASWDLKVSLSFKAWLAFWKFVLGSVIPLQYGLESVFTISDCNLQEGKWKIWLHFCEGCLSLTFQVCDFSGSFNFGAFSREDISRSCWLHCLKMEEPTVQTAGQVSPALSVCYNWLESCLLTGFRTTSCGWLHLHSYNVNEGILLVTGSFCN